MHELRYRELAESCGESKVLIDVDLQFVQSVQSIVEYWLFNHVLGFVGLLGTAASADRSTTTSSSLRPLHYFCELDQVFDNDFNNLPNDLCKVFSDFLLNVEVHVVHEENQRRLKWKAEIRNFHIHDDILDRENCLCPRFTTRILPLGCTGNQLNVVYDVRHLWWHVNLGHFLFVRHELEVLCFHFCHEHI